MADVLFIIGVIAVIIIFVIFLYHIFDDIEINGATIPEQKFRQHFNNLHGDAFDEEAKMALNEAKRIRNMRPIDRYRLGVVHLINEQNRPAAAREFQTAIDDIIEHKLEPTEDFDNGEVIFVVDRIQDFQDLFMEDLELDGIETIINILGAELFNGPKTEKKQVVISENDPEKVQKKILAEQQWFSDPQNVHDRTIMKEFSDQYRKVVAENLCDSELAKHSYEEVKTYMLGRVSMKNSQTTRVVKLFETLDKNYPAFFDGSVREQDIITAIWQRIHDKGNAANATDMKNALLDAICDCTEGGTVVCATGRPLKLWQSMALLDKDPTVGTVSNKQIIRNEILEQAAKWADEILNSAPPHVKLSYDKGEETDDTKELIETIYQKFEELRKLYKGKLDDKQLNLIIEQCRHCV